MNPYSRQLMPFLKDLEPDEAGPDPEEVSKRYGIPVEEILVLSRNESPYGPSPRVWEALEGVHLHRYPDSRPFLRALSEYAGYPEGNIVAGAGMDEIITTIARLFLGPGERALIPVPTYTFYAVAVRLCGAVPLYQQRNADFSVDAPVQDNIKMIFLCSPNNPTGNCTSEDAVRSIVESTDAIIFLDEAYAEFAGRSLLKLVGEYENLVVGRTLSKAFGLAGMRLGYAVAPEWIAEHYRKISPLFSVSSLSVAAGVAALKDLEHMRESVAKIVSERERLQRSINGAFPSLGNFLFIHTGEGSSLVVKKLLQRGIIVRNCDSIPGAGKYCIRVTISTPAENDLFLEAFTEANRH